jgi:hypothetical protein
VYVDTDDDVRLARRIQRDVTCRGRDVAGVIEQYTKFVKPAFDTFIGPSRWAHATGAGRQPRTPPLPCLHPLLIRQALQPARPPSPARPLPPSRPSQPGPHVHSPARAGATRT